MIQLNKNELHQTNNIDQLTPQLGIFPADSYVVETASGQGNQINN